MTLAIRALKKTALMVVSSFIAICFVWVVGEAYFRIAYNVKGSTSLAEWTEFDPVIGWRMRPGSYSAFDVGAFTSTRIFINELGIRNGPVTLSVPRGTKRTTVLGDSFVFAAALNEGDKFTDGMQELAGPGTEIVNAGVPGYGTGQEILLLQGLVARGFEIGGKLVLVFFTNDVADNAGIDYGTTAIVPWKPAFIVDSHGELRHSTPERLKKATNGPSADGLALTHRSIFLQFLRSRGEVVVSRFPALIDLLASFGYQPELGRVPGVISTWYSEGWEKEWKRTEDILIYLDKYLRRTGTELTVAVIPSPFQVETAFKTLIENQKDRDMRFTAFLADIDRPQRTLEQFCKRMSIRFVDTTPALREQSKSTPVYFLREGHLNLNGSKVVANVLHRATNAGQ